MATKPIALGPVGERFGPELRRLRRRARWDLHELSEELGKIGHPMGINTISRLERGERRPDVADLIAFAVALNVPPMEFYLPHRVDGPMVQLTPMFAIPWDVANAWVRGSSNLPSRPVPTVAGTIEVTLSEGKRMLDDSARYNLGISGEEFLAAWDENRIPDADSLAVQQVASLIPFAR